MHSRWNERARAEEEYLKAIFHLSGEEGKKVSSASLVEKTGAKPPSVTEMLHRLKEMGYILYEKYRGCELTAKGRQAAVQVIRKHRLWETFLVRKLGFGWDEVHQVADQLEHIRSAKLIDGIDHLLGYPKVDPHGEPIPDKEGHMAEEGAPLPLNEVEVGSVVEVARVHEDAFSLLRHLDRVGIQLGTRLRVVDRIPFDGSMSVAPEGETPLQLSEKMAQSIAVRLISIPSQ